MKSIQLLYALLLTIIIFLVSRRLFFKQIDSLQAGLYTIIIVLLFALLAIYNMYQIILQTTTSFLTRELIEPCSQQKCNSPDQGYIPLFDIQDSTIQDSRKFYTDIAQMCFYHDLVWDNKQKLLPGTIIFSQNYSKDSATDPPVVCVFTSGQIVYILFRGTFTKQEWIQDARESQTILDKIGHVHTGIGSIYSEFREKLTAILTSQPSSKIITYGHSLGGGMADIFAIDMFNNNKDLWSKLLVIAVAAPRVLPPDIVDNFQNAKPDPTPQLMHIVNIADVVPCIPVSVTDLGENKVYIYKQYTANQLVFNDPKNSILENHMAATYANALVTSTVKRSNFF